MTLFEKIAQNATFWGKERDNFGNAHGSADNEVLKALTQKVSMLTSKLEKLSTSPSVPVHMIQICETCGVKGHGSESCFLDMPSEELNALYGNTYNPNYKHPNLSDTSLLHMFLGHVYSLDRH